MEEHHTEQEQHGKLKWVEYFTVLEYDMYSPAFLLMCGLFSQIDTPLDCSSMMSFHRFKSTVMADTWCSKRKPDDLPWGQSKEFNWQVLEKSHRWRPPPPPQMLTFLQPWYWQSCHLLSRLHTLGVLGVVRCLLDLGLVPQLLENEWLCKLFIGFIFWTHRGQVVFGSECTWSCTS